MSHIPASIPPLLSTLAPHPNPPSSTEASPGSTSANTRLVTNGNYLPKSKLQNVPAFLNKLYNMVEDASTDSLIRWSEDGMSFTVTRHEEFAKKVLPRFFKHSNFSSFVRQLNMYGFHKVPHVQQGALNSSSSSKGGSSSSSSSSNGNSEAAERWEFSNPHFQRNQPDLLLLVTRKKGRDTDEKEGGAVDLHHILDEIAAIKKHQASISNELKNVQNETQLLWQENVASRERHHKHQETIDKILRFLASVFSNDNKKPGVTPRKRQFLLGDGSTPSNDTAAVTASTTELPLSATAGGHQNMAQKRRFSKIEEVEDEDVEENIRPVRKSAKKASFTLPDFATSSSSDTTMNSDWPFFRLGSSLPTATSATPATEDLAAAIALNNQTKKDSAASLASLPPKLSSSSPTNTTTTTSIPGLWTIFNTNPSNNTLNTATPASFDLSTLVNMPQFQGLVNLAQTNPALFNQLTNTNYFEVPQTAITPSSTTTTATGISSPPLPTLSNSVTPIGTPIVPAETSLETPTTAEDLESSLKSLATELGFETLNSPINGTGSIVNGGGLDVMDEFINTYTPQASPSLTAATVPGSGKSES